MEDQKEIKLNENQKMLQDVFNVARMARVEANVHEQITAHAQKLFQVLADSEDQQSRSSATQLEEGNADNNGRLVTPEIVKAGER